METSKTKENEEREERRERKGTKKPVLWRRRVWERSKRPTLDTTTESTVWRRFAMTSMDVSLSSSRNSISISSVDP
jgi:hypothetical protein